MGEGLIETGRRERQTERMGEGLIVTGRHIQRQRQGDRLTNRDRQTEREG